jgi:23S rRNA (adenine2503-C2)-methyltransferase
LSFCQEPLTTMLPLIYDLSLSDISLLMKEWHEPSYRAHQIWHGLYRQFINSSDELTNLPTHLRTQLTENLQFKALTPSTTLKSTDGNTEKSLFRLYDGNGIETVLMRYNKRNTLCISTQSGCAMECVFCATGQMGFKRHLSRGEIIAQVMYYARQLQGLGDTVTNVVVMGMGEPFHNYDNTLAAIDRLNDPKGYNFGARRFTISTVGLIPGIRRFAVEKRQVNLAISLHSAEDCLRSSMLPINKRYPVDELLEACREYVAMTNRRITFEWALINGINDTPEQANLLASRIKDLLCHVNAIPLNPTKGYPGQATSHKQAEVFKQILNESGIPCTIRLRRGMDIQAGCGQLIIQSQYL